MGSVLEAHVLTRLAHPNIVAIYDIVWEDGMPLFRPMKLVSDGISAASGLPSVDTHGQKKAVARSPGPRAV